MFRATALVYSSHNRCEYIHRQWIVERALQSIDNKTILHLPMSMGRMDQQEYSWGTFRWYFNQFLQWGLQPMNFYWRSELSKEDVDFLFDCLASYEVVILGGGSSTLGMQRYRELGEHYYGDRQLFQNILHERQNQGKLTAGFSAGADQLCEYLVGVANHNSEESMGFGLAHNIMTTLHHEWGREGYLKANAREFAHCAIFGLPNDSGIAVDQGYSSSGNIWQVIEFVVDQSWDLPQDAFHIKSRQGMNIEHYYCDGRHWTFKNGDRMVRIMSPDSREQDAWILQPNRAIVNYWTQQPTGYESIEEILSGH